MIGVGASGNISQKRYKTLSSFMKEYFGEKVYKVSVDGGFTCPVRDGTKGWRGCIFCNIKSFTPPYAERARSVKDQILEGIENVKKFRKARKYVVYFQPYTNTYADVEKLRKLYNEALEAHPDIVGIFIGTRPDCLSYEIIDLLDELNRKTFLVVELGLQSSNNRTLELIKRGHTVEDYIDATKKLHERNIRTLPHIIIGLPGDTEQDYINGARLISDLGVFAVKIHPLHVVKFTELELWYRKGEYKPLEISEYVEYVGLFLENLSPRIYIARITGEAPDKFLVAPEWCKNKFKVIQEIDLYLEKKNIYQGASYESQRIVNIYQ